MTAQHAQTTMTQPQAPETNVMTQNAQLHDTQSGTARTLPPRRSLMHMVAPEIIRSDVTEEELRERVERQRKAYMNRRERLETSTRELERLRKAVGALESQEKTADVSWRRDFLNGFGKQSKAVRDQLKQKTQWRLEAEQQREMIALLEPQVEWLKIHTHNARIAFVQAQSHLVEFVAHRALMECAEAFARSEVADKLYEALPVLFRRIDSETRRSHRSLEGRMLSDEIERRQYAAIGELLLSFRPQKLPVLAIEGGEGVSTLDCEADPSEFRSEIGVRRRLEDAEAKMELLPDLNAIDNE